MKALPFIWASMFGIAAAEISAVPHPAAAFDKQQTVVWSPLFQAAWDAAVKPYGEVTKVEPRNKLVEDLGAFKWDVAKVMPEGSWKAWNGPANFEFLNKANAEAAKMTGEAKGPFSMKEESPISDATFALLDRQVAFRKKMQPCLTAPLVFKTAETEKPVRYFGLRNEAPAEAIRVVSFNGPARSHALQLRCQDGDDTVILYLPPEPQDFTTACLWLRTWASQSGKEIDGHAFNDPALHEGDEVRIPYLDLDSTQYFEDALSGWLHFSKGVPRRVTRAEQKTRFKLHEAGASVRSEASLQMTAFGPAPAIHPRKFIYDRPFFVFLWREGAEWPYFGAWIGNAEGMQPFDK